jgi:hypothetical protein
MRNAVSTRCFEDYVVFEVDLVYIMLDAERKHWSPHGIKAIYLLCDILQIELLYLSDHNLIGAIKQFKFSVAWAKVPGI